MSDPNLSKSQEAYIKKMEREKIVRELMLTRMKKRNRLFLLGGITTVLSICMFIN